MSTYEVNNLQKEKEVGASRNPGPQNDANHGKASETYTILQFIQQVLIEHLF